MRKLLSVAVIALCVFATSSAQTDITLKAKAYLQAAVSGTFDVDATNGKPLMRDNLRNNPVTGATYIPSQDPYSVGTEYTDFITDYYTHVGSGGDYANTTIENPTYIFGLTGSDAIVDWVFVELRSKWNYTQVVATRSALIQRDGDIVDLDAESDIVFHNVIEDDYYIAVRHRNHLAIMTADPYSISDMAVGIDFTDPNLALFDYGTSMPSRDYTGMSTNHFTANNVNYRCLWSGDFNADGKIKYDMPMSDLNNLYKDVISFEGNTGNDTNYANAYGYFQSDADMDGRVKYNTPGDDTNSLFQSIQLYPLNTNGDLNYDFFLAQLPK